MFVVEVIKRLHLEKIKESEEDTDASHSTHEEVWQGLDKKCDI